MKIAPDCGYQTRPPNPWLEHVPLTLICHGRACPACPGHPDAEGTAFRQNALGVAPCPVDRDHRDEPGDDAGGCVDLIGTCSSAASTAWLTAGNAVEAIRSRFLPLGGVELDPHPPAPVGTPPVRSQFYAADFGSSDQCSDPGVVRVSPVSSSVLIPERSIGQPP
jgi:hypothetical protein